MHKINTLISLIINWQICPIPIKDKTIQKSFIISSPPEYCTIFYRLSLYKHLASYPYIFNDIPNHYRVSYNYWFVSQRYRKFIIPPHIQVFSFSIFSYEDNIFSIIPSTYTTKCSLLIRHLFIDGRYFFFSGHCDFFEDKILSSIALASVLIFILSASIEKTLSLSSWDKYNKDSWI